MSILERICTDKIKEISNLKQIRSIEYLQAKLAQISLQESQFFNKIAVAYQAKQPAVIAEIKKASPSKGVLKEDFNPLQIASLYKQHGAYCLSIVTESKYFQGSDIYLKTVRKKIDLPVLRKDFILDKYQIYESKLIGADAILLIAAILTDQELLGFTTLAKDLLLDVLVEVHNLEELKRFNNLFSVRDRVLLGVNNRNLRNFKVDINNSINLKQLTSPEQILITESGITTKKDIQLMLKHHIYGFLIGETFIRSENPGKELARLIS